MRVRSYATDAWHTSSDEGRPVHDATSGELVATVSSTGLDFARMLAHARRVGGPTLRGMTFHQRAAMLKGVAKALSDRKQELYEASFTTGATKTDAWVDVDGGFGALFVYASKGRRELPDDLLLLDGDLERLSKSGAFAGHHVQVSRQGVAVHINAFNFPVWGMTEKLACTWLAGMPAVVKPASATSHVTAKAVEIMLDAGVLPPGALQLVCGGVGDLFDHLRDQDVVTFTGSAVTGRKLKAHPGLAEHGVRFNMEADSLNFSMLGPDVQPGSATFDAFVREVSNEMRIKTGQRCTAIRRTLVPRTRLDEVADALKAVFEATPVGRPGAQGVKMGPLVGLDQRAEVQRAVDALAAENTVLYGSYGQLVDADPERGAFFPFTLLRADDPLNHRTVHEVEAFGPVNTLLPYDDLDTAWELIRMGRGSLVGSVMTDDDAVARQAVLQTAAYHGRLMFLNADSQADSTGHGSPMPHLVHGGPGRAGGGEEMGGMRGLSLYMQRTAVQGSPTTLTSVARTWLPGAARHEAPKHPFRMTFDEIAVGDTLTTHRRTVTEADVTNFAGISGDFFYAHMDDVAARESIFERRVAHGYFVLSAAAGLFVDPGVGPVLANYGLENLRFVQPVYPGDTIRAKLTCKRRIAKAPRPDERPQGVVEWHVDVENQDEALVATYTILTLVARDA
ncbi:MAG: phenylacetic acid degradation bifunctional protein PaaZ [Myxococcales bacterium]|nr:phenylacetic acid degradation bifunctional protein PaaZ [Myxococcales bacterium]